MTAIFLLSSRDGPGRTARSPAGLESVFFAFVKFIMCLMVPEVKAVSCAPELVVQVPELHKKKRFFSTFRKAPEQPFPAPWNDARTAAFSPAGAA